MAEAPSSPKPSGEEARRSSSRRRSAINLIDHTKPTEEEQAEMPNAEEPEDSRRSTFGTSLREQRTRLKYHRYAAHKVDSNLSKPPTTVHDSPAEEIDRWGKSHLERGIYHIQDQLHIKRQKRRSQNENSEIAILYENERGLFTFGIPHFSSKALMPIDPSPWVDAEFQKSRVNITNAQVPDPSWEWAWKTWYVDMSGDVDEEGWEYSFAFFKCCAWHGNHPWFHSYVRRRRWIRKRVRRHSYVPDRTFGDAHMMNQDYFTIHAGNLKSLSAPTSPLVEDASEQRQWGVEEEEPWESKDIEDIGSLIRALREAPVDSERIAVIKNFLDNGGDDLYYLADEIPKIMSYFFYGSSCQRLLKILNDKVEEEKARRVEEAKNGKAERENDKKYMDNLLRSVVAVEEQCKKLEFWSDARDHLDGSEKTESEEDYTTEILETKS